jgi:hypothetical protein
MRIFGVALLLRMHFLANSSSSIGRPPGPENHPSLTVNLSFENLEAIHFSSHLIKANPFLTAISSHHM